jgi:hypothetical protein
LTAHSTILGPPSPDPHTPALHSGSTGHYFSLNVPLQGIQPTKEAIEVEVANEQTMKLTHEGLILIRGLPLAAGKCHLFEELRKTSLILMGILVDHGCKIHLEEDSAIVTLEDYVILEGTRHRQEVYG